MADTIEVRVPNIGDFHDVPVIEVLVKPGDTVRVDDALLTLESDKATMEVPSPEAGVVAAITIWRGRQGLRGHGHPNANPRGRKRRPGGCGTRIKWGSGDRGRNHARNRERNGACCGGRAGGCCGGPAECGECGGSRALECGRGRTGTWGRRGTACCVAAVER
jgi:hypothetical protein